MEHFSHNNLTVNIDSLGRVILSGQPLRRLPVLEWENFNTDISLFNGKPLRTADGECEERDNLLEAESIVRDENRIVTEHICSEQSLRIKAEYELIPGCNAVRQINRIENTGEKNIVITDFASAKALFVGLENGPWFSSPERWTAHYCRSSWQGEAQWHSASLEELGMYPTNSHSWNRCSWVWSSLSSWSTSSAYPALILEDTESGVSWFFEIGGGVSWRFECATYGGTGVPSFNVSVSAASEENAWKYELAPGERYSSLPAVYGMVKGGFEEAVCELLKCKRAYSLRRKTVPVVYNDYMNCLWGQLSAEKMLPLIETAAQLGCECYCVDAGWEKQLGEWIPEDSRFGEGGFQKIIDRISQCGMIPGVWFEMESVSEVFAAAHPGWVITRNGSPVPFNRPLVDFRCSEAVEFLRGCVRDMYNRGIRYIKNDYNKNTGIGTDKYGESPAEGLVRNTEAFLGFIESLSEEFPDLMIESCSSGGMRADFGITRHFSLQSVSDQEDYRLMPSLVTGLSALIPPERLGIWAYPYPQNFGESDETAFSEERRRCYADGEQTVFNLVSAMMGSLYLSGRIDMADGFNRSLIAGAVSLKKQWRSFTERAYPVYFHPPRRICDKSFSALGLRFGRQTLLAVWNLEQTKFSVDISKLGNAAVKPLFLSDFGSYRASFENGIINISAGGKNRARLFLLETADGV